VERLSSRISLACGFYCKQAEIEKLKSIADLCGVRVNSKFFKLLPMSNLERDAKAIHAKTSL
jgi:hypothetical protein